LGDWGEFVKEYPAEAQYKPAASGMTEQLKRVLTVARTISGDYQGNVQYSGGSESLALTLDDVIENTLLRSLLRARTHFVEINSLAAEDDIVNADVLGWVLQSTAKLEKHVLDLQQPLLRHTAFAKVVPDEQSTHLDHSEDGRLRKSHRQSSAHLSVFGSTANSRCSSRAEEWTDDEDTSRAGSASSGGQYPPASTSALGGKPYAPRKRNRKQEACKTCRSRKVKCDLQALTQSRSQDPASDQTALSELICTQCSGKGLVCDKSNLDSSKTDIGVPSPPTSTF
jgi:hypothetical protein